MLATSLKAGVKDMPANYFILVVKSSIVLFSLWHYRSFKNLKKTSNP